MHVKRVRPVRPVQPFQSVQFRLVRPSSPSSPVPPKVRSVRPVQSSLEIVPVDVIQHTSAMLARKQYNEVQSPFPLGKQ